MSKTIEVYLHPAAPADQVPDTQPGAYYVSARDGGRTTLLAGPYMNDHAGALAAVDKCRKLAAETDPRARWYFYGTCRFRTLSIPFQIGKFNAQLGLITEHMLRE